MSLRKCKRCGLEAHNEEELTAFVQHAESKHGYALLCKKCKGKQYPNSLDARQRTRAKMQYGITLEEYKECMATSDVCQICDSPDTLCYDHCHDSMAFRGVLCRKCNQALGLLGDTAAGVQRALDYLKKSKEAGRCQKKHNL